VPATEAGQTSCIECGAEDAPHLGENRTTRVADGVVRDERVHRCDSCQAAHRSGDCPTCVKFDAEKAAAQETFDHSKISDVRVLRQLHRDRGECRRAQ
jgi:hypothetical protein